MELFAELGGFRVEVSGDVSRTAVAGDELAAVQHFNAALEDARRAGLTAVPEPVELTRASLGAARRA